MNRRGVLVLILMVAAIISGCEPGFGPTDVAFDPNGRVIYVAGGNYLRGGEAVWIVDAQTHQVVRMISTGAAASALAFNSSSAHLLISTLGRPSGQAGSSPDGQLMIMTPAGQIQQRVSLKPPPSRMVFDPTGNRLYVSHGLAREVSVLDGSTYSVAATIPLTHPPGDMLLDPGSGRVYVSHPLTDTVSVVDPAQNYSVMNLAVPGPYSLAIHPSSGHLLVVSSPRAPGSTTARLLTIDLGTGQSLNAVATGRCYGGIAVHAALKRAYIGDWCENRIAVVDLATNTVIGGISQVPSPVVLRFNPAGVRLYALNQQGSITVIDPVRYTIVATIRP